MEALKLAVMRPDELKAAFDQQASGYDTQWARMAPIREGLYFLLDSLFSELPATARILCVGVGTGAELAYLARAYPGWRFTAVDPSGPMLDVCRRRLESEGQSARCAFHEGYLESLPDVGPHDAATCFLVSQFILATDARRDFFRSIAARLVPGGALASADLASDVNSPAYDRLLRSWLMMMTPSGIDDARVERARAEYAKNVSILPPDAVASLMEAAGFDKPVQFFQAGLMHAWICRRPALASAIPSGTDAPP